MCRLCHAPQNTTNPILRPLSAIKQIQMGSWMCTTVSKWCTTMHIYILHKGYTPVILCVMTHLPAGIWNVEQKGSQFVS